jgi:hypothetical protein
MTKKLLTLENIRSGAFPSDAHAVGFLLGEIERLQGEYNAYRADGEPELRAANAEIMRLLCREQQLMNFVRSFISGGVNQDFKPWASELYQKLYSSHEPKVGAPFPYPTDRDGWICSGCHGWNGPKTRVCLHSHVPLDPQGASRDEPCEQRRCVCGEAVIPEGELRVEVGTTTHRLAGPCFQTSSQGASRDTSPLSIAGTGCGNPVMTSAQSYAPCKQPEGHIGECDPPPQRT